MRSVLDAASPPLPVLSEIGEAWHTVGHGRRLAAVLEGGRALRNRLLAGPSAVAVRTLPLATLAYPTKYAFWAAAYAPLPYIAMEHRCLLVQFRQQGAVKTLLFNPSDVDRARNTPFFARLIQRYGRAAELLSRRFDPLEAQLAALGLSRASIDYIAFDHFHTQDLRTQLGTADGRIAPRFPNATLLAPRSEWLDWDQLHPMQKAWFVPDGIRGVREERVCFTEQDLLLGDGVALIRTPGHTAGNQTLFVKTSQGIWGCSENGVCADNWSPRASRIAGLRALAEHQELEFVLNANTPELGADQYTSMALEKALVDPVRGHEDFCQMFSSSEAIGAWFAPGFAPTYRHGAITHGEIALA